MLSLTPVDMLAGRFGETEVTAVMSMLVTNEACLSSVLLEVVQAVTVWIRIEMVFGERKTIKQTVKM